MAVPHIFNLQKFSVHDGPGIRTTVFFKGCPLRCLWCHNPESQNFHKELLYDSAACTQCSRCVRGCPEQAVTLTQAAVYTDKTKCKACGACTDTCLACARTVAGRSAGIAELLTEIEKDIVFYEQSGGGVTFSGGEPCCQPEVLEQLARECRLRGIHVTIDTCGHVPFNTLERLLGVTDLFLYDLKHLDPDIHRQYTGQDNTLILSNLRRLAAAGANIHLRLPLIAKVNDDHTHIQAVIAFARSLHIHQVSLLPYHNTGSSKYQRLGSVYAAENMSPPSPERLHEIKSCFAAAAFQVGIGG